MKEKSRKTVNKAVSVQVMRDSDAWTIANKIPLVKTMLYWGEVPISWKYSLNYICGIKEKGFKYFKCASPIY